MAELPTKVRPALSLLAQMKTGFADLPRLAGNQQERVLAAVLSFRPQMIELLRELFEPKTIKRHPKGELGCILRLQNTIPQAG